MWFLVSLYYSRACVRSEYNELIDNPCSCRYFAVEANFRTLKYRIGT